MRPNKDLARLLRPLGISLAVAAIAVGGATACSKTIDGKSAETAIKQKLQAQRPEGGNITVSCPSSIPAKSGSTFNCTLKADDGSTIGITATQTDDNGTFDFKVDQAPSGGDSSGGGSSGG